MRAHHVDAHAAAAGHRVGRPRDRQLERLVELRERRLVDAHRMHFDHALRRAQPVAGVVLRRSRRSPSTAARAPTGALHRHGHDFRLARRRASRLACRSRASSPSRRRRPVAHRPRELASSGCAVVLRSVNIALNSSCSRTTGGSPEKSIRSCVVRTVAVPWPNFAAPACATATMRKLVSESLSGTSTVARPCASSATRAFHSEQRVEQLARAGAAAAAAGRDAPSCRSGACR